MPERTREESERLVVDAVKEWLPTLPVGSVVYIEATDPDTNEHGAHFTVSQSPGAFSCRRGS